MLNVLVNPQVVQEISAKTGRPLLKLVCVNPENGQQELVDLFREYELAMAALDEYTPITVQEDEYGFWIVDGEPVAIKDGLAFDDLHRAYRFVADLLNVLQYR